MQKSRGLSPSIPLTLAKKRQCFICMGLKPLAHIGVKNVSSPSEIRFSQVLTNQSPPLTHSYKLFIINIITTSHI